MRLAEGGQNTHRSTAIAQPADFGGLPERLPWRIAAPFILALSLALWIVIIVGLARLMGLA